MKVNKNESNLYLLGRYLGIGLLVGAILSIVGFQKPIEKFISNHPWLTVFITFISGLFFSPFYLSYLQTVGKFKFKEMPEGVIKRWNSPARNLEEVFGKRTRGKVLWRWPVKPMKKKRARSEYKAIWEYHLANPQKTYAQMAEHFDLVDTKKVERAIRAGKSGEI